MRKVLTGILSFILLAGIVSGCGSYSPSLPEEEVESDIFVSKIEGLSPDFIKGMDISSLLVEEASGVKYYDEQGKEADLCKILADAGVNYVRVRVWMDPFDEEGNGYGGGNCTVDTAIAIGLRAKKYGMKTCVDFHYSDFWADPNKQMCPKIWRGKGIGEKIELTYDYTKESVARILDAGVDLGMVQIGNETNNGIAGIKSQDNLAKFLANGCKAVRDISSEKGKDIKIAVHFTGIDDYDGTLKRAALLKEYGVDYDIFGVSYYSFWHGKFENMKKVLSNIHDEYGVDTCIMETSYPFTSEDTDGTGNSIAGDNDIIDGYPATVQGQAKMVRDVMANASEAGALGVFYWEGAWISVGDDYDDNQKKWEEFGSGWASSYAASYDPTDAGRYYGGSSWDNQAFFDKTGHPLESLNVFKYVNHGAKAPLEILAVKNVNFESPIGEPLNLPSTVEAVYNDSEYTGGVAVTWDEDICNSIDVNTNGKYPIKGITENGWEIEGTVKVCSINYVKNGSFEEPDISMWQVAYPGSKNQTDIQTKEADAYEGEKAFHFWDTEPIDFTVTQTIENIAPGNYSTTVFMQGGDMGDSQDNYFFVTINGEEYERVPVTVEGWVKWQNPIITDIPVKEGDEVVVGMHVSGAAKGWGTIDGWEMY